jgi:6-phosphogluconolactonase
MKGGGKRLENGLAWTFAEGNGRTPMNPTLAAAGLGVVLALTPSSQAQDPFCWVYFGTSATDANRGIYVSKLDEQTGELSPAQRVADKSDSVFMAFSPDHRRIYSLAEVPGPGTTLLEAIETNAVDPATGRLASLGERVSDGPEGCHITVDPSGRCVIVSNYKGHYIEVFPISADTTVGARTCLIRHLGSGPNHDRQQEAHPHSTNVDPTGRFAIVADLGLDRLFVYRLDAGNGVLSPNDPPFATIAPGAGPRHFAFHPDGRHAFVINEMGGSITAMNWDSEKGVLTPYQTISILPSGFNGVNTSAEVVVGSGGKVVYGSNRGDDSIVVLAFDPASGVLTFVQRVTDGIKTPRNYAIDPSGKWLVCGNLTANSAGVYRIEAGTGRLALAGTIQVPQPLCVRFVQP